MIPVIAFLFGLLVGSFLGVCIHRWPRDESVLKPVRSQCPQCGRKIAWFDNIPVLSYFLLKRRCRHCSEPIPARYPIVELLNGALYAYIFWRFGLDPNAFKVAVFTSMMLILIFTDLRDYILPDEITLGGLVLAFVLIPFIPLDARFTSIFWIFSTEQPAQWVVSLVEAGFSALFVGCMLLTVRWGYFQARKVEGLGLGDVKMMTMVAAFWGLAPTITILMLGSIIGAITGLLIIWIGGKKWQHELPFGSYLGATAIFVAIWADDLFRWYAQAATS